ncbi:APC family permease [Thermoleophilia bacterium SCSIO 60948]|nr:APC family permease [Thermoleophilia bacterium SCSIO 60948]
MEAATGTRSQDAPTRGKLQRRALGVPDLVFFIVAASAPLTVVAGGVSATYLVTGNTGVPLLFLVLAAILALFVSGYAAMSHHVTNAGAFYAYVAKGISKTVGVGTAFVALIAYNAMQIGIAGLFGAVFGGFVSAQTGFTMDWWAWCFVAIAVIGVLGWLRVDLNAKVLALFLTAEVIVVAFFDVVVAGNPSPEGISFATAYDPSIAFGAAVGAALTFTMAAFVGFESGAIYSEECKEPRRTVARATYISLGAIAIFYSISAWMLQSAAGPSVVVDPVALVDGGYATAGAPDPVSILFVTLAVNVSAPVADIATLLFCTSLFAAMLSFHNAVARYCFALGRAGVLPRVFSRVRESSGAPFVGSSAQTVLAVVVIGLFALSGSDPVLNLFTWLTNLGALGIFLLLALASFSVVGYFSRNHHGESAWSTRIAPAISGVLLTAIFILALANFNVLITSMQGAPLDDRAIILPAILIGGGLIGLALGAYLKRSKPEIYARIGEGGEEVP